MSSPVERTLSFARALGTRAGLEDLVTPSSRDQALRELVADAGITRGDHVVELGARGGRLLHHLRPVLAGRDARYTGVDVPSTGTHAAQETAWSLALADYTRFVESESRTVVPLPSRSHDVAFLHFALHELASHERRSLLDDVHRVLNEGGRLLVAELAMGYDPGLVARTSAQRDAELRHLDPGRRLWNRLAGDRLLRMLEGAVAAQVRRGALHAYDEPGLRAELDGAGFAVDWVKIAPQSGTISARAHVKATAARRGSS
ncbi:MAG: class I SAM-dependent methyltransferase [Kofleriaceae bacterium]